MEKQNISCPKCNHQFHVEDVLNKELEIKYQQKFNTQIAKLEKKKNDDLKDLEQKEKAFEAKIEKARKNYTQKIDNDRKLIAEEERKRATEHIRKDFEVELENYKLQANKKNELSIELQKLKLAINDKDAELKNAKDLAKIEAKKELIEKEKQIEASLTKKMSEENELKIREYKKQFDQQNKIIEDLKRKSEQGSMQLQGEVQELAIEEYLKAKFPFDNIEEIKKGAKGGDCIQHINTREMQNCGKIYYESKRTQNFSNDWIEKFKADLRAKKIDIGVLVTKTMPKDMQRMGLKNGIWVCTFDEFKALCFVLRINCIKISSKLAIQQNKGGKMEMLYNFLTSSEFKMQIEAIVEGFQTMKADLDKEKISTQKNWKKREKQLEKVIENTTNFYGSIEGIAGEQNIAKIDALNVEEEENENDLELF